MNRSQQKIVNELREAFRQASTSIEEATVGAFVFVTTYRVSADCKSRGVNVFKVGPRGGLKVVRQDYKA